jgi:hypothetical protein
MAKKANKIKPENESKPELDVMSKVNAIAVDGLNVIHEIVLNGEDKPEVRLNAAKWAVELLMDKQSTGANLETISSYIQLLKSLSDKSPKQAISKEILKDKSLTEDEWERWLDDHFHEDAEKSEK